MRASALTFGLLALGGCGHGRQAKAPASACLHQVQTVIAQYLAVPAHSVAAMSTTSSAATPECDFRVAAGRSAARVKVSATIDSGPQAEFRFQRTVEEQGQQFGSVRLAAPPEDVRGIGLDADWFPDQTELMTTDGKRLITVTVSWPAANPKRWRAIAERVARVYVDTRP